MIADRKTKRIICVAETRGKVHDFALYKNTIGERVSKNIKGQADSGYQGIEKYHPNSETPKKKPRGGELTDDEKRENQRIAKEQIFIEHINSRIKVFKIMKYPYRNRRKRHHLRLNLICGIINSELTN